MYSMYSSRFSTAPAGAPAPALSTTLVQVLAPIPRTVDLRSACKGPYGNTVLSVAGRLCVTVGTVLSHIPTDMTITIDHSGSMTLRHRQVVASKVAALLRAQSAKTVMYSFGNTASVYPITAESYRADNQSGTKLNAAASAMIKAATYPGIASDAAICIITDCEQVSDYACAFETLRDSHVSFFNRRLFLVGIGSEHFIPDLQSLLPIETAMSAFYVNIPDTSSEIPSDALLSVLHAVPITYGGSTMYVKPGTSYLFPPDCVSEDVTVSGLPLSSFPVTAIGLPSKAVLVTLAEAAACTATRKYNAALASLKQIPGGMVHISVQNRVLQPVRENIARDLAFLDGIASAINAAETVAVEGETSVSDRVQAVEDAAAGGTPLPELTAATIQRYRISLRRMPGAQLLLNLLREIKELIDDVVTAASYAAASELFDATSRGNLSTASLSKLRSKVASRQVDDAWQKTLTPLIEFETSGVRVTGSPFPRVLTEEEASVADTIDAYGVGEAGYPWPCCVTMAESNACVVAVGTVSRRPLVGALNQAITRAESVNMMPYHLSVVHHCFENGIVTHAYEANTYADSDAENDDAYGGATLVSTVQPHCFATHIGTVNGIVGLMPGPGRSHAHAIALGIMASEVGTGNWTTPGHGFRALVAVGLIGVAYLLEHDRRDDARVLAFGFLGTAARLGCRELQANGEPKEGDVYITALAAAELLLTKAAASPTTYLGPQLFRVDLWRALVFAMELLHSMRESTPSWDVEEFKKTLVVYDIVSAATWAVQPKSTKDSTLFALEKKAIDAFRAEVFCRIGLPASMDGAGVPIEDEVILSDALRAFAAQPTTITYSLPTDIDVLQEGVHESVFLDNVLPAPYKNKTAVLRLWARAIFWATVAMRGSNGVTAEALLASRDPSSFMESTRVKIVSQSAIAKASAEKNLREALKQAFFNAADCVPFGFYDDRTNFSVSTSSCAGTPIFTSAMTVPEMGVCFGRSTGMPQKVCMSVDSPAFLVKSIGAHRSAVYPLKGLGFSQNIPRFHATLSTFWTVDGIRDEATMFEKAVGVWPELPIDVLMVSLKQWFVQRQAFDVVNDCKDALSGEEVCHRLGIDFGVATRAADWDSSDIPILTELYPENVQQWSYAVTAAHFYAAVKRDTMPSTGVFNARPFLEALAVHRRCVVPRRIFMKSVTAHGLAPSLFIPRELFDAIVADVYETQVRSFRVCM